MYRRKTVLTILLSFFISTTTAQRQLFKVYTTQDGLAGNRILDIYQDSKGFLWIGTWEGISRYDGHKFTNFSTTNGLSYDMVNDFIEDNEKLYIALNDGSVDVFENKRLRKLGKFATPLNRFIRLPNGKIILPSDANGFHELKNGNIIKPAQENPLQNSQFLLSADDSLLVSYGANQLSVFTKDYRLLATANVWNITSGINYLVKDSQRRIWLCTNQGLRIFSFNPISRKFSIEVPPADLIPVSLVNKPATAIYETEDGLLWISCTAGLVRLRSSGSFTIFTKEDGLPASTITTIFNDKERNLWLGTANGLIKLVRQKEIDHISFTDQLNAGDVLSIASLKDGQLMMSTYKGPVIFDPVTYNKKQITIPFKNIPPIYHEGTYPWVFLGEEGYFQQNSTQNKMISLKKEKLFISSEPITDTQGNGFTGLMNNIGILSNGKVWIKNAPDRVTSMTIDNKGYLWIGTWQKGLFRIKYDIGKDSVRLLFSNFSQLVPDSSIRSLFSSKDGSIWVGTRNKGAYRLKFRNGKDYTTEGFDKKAGLSSNFITAFAETENKDIWIGSIYGLDKLIKTNNSFRIFNFSRINNLLGAVHKIKPAGNNNLWCVIDQKTIRITDHFLENKSIAPPVITRIRLGSRERPVEVYNTDSVISLTYSQNQAQFQFAAPSFINESQVLYSYRLLGGIDSSWSEPINIHEVYYASLQPGHYNFQVRTLGWNMQYSEIASYSFQVLPPFWQTWWFVLLCFLLVAALFYLLYRFRVKQLIKVQNVRNRIATDLHDDIGSTLTNIGILAQLSQKNLNDQPQAAKYLERITEEITESGQSLDDIIWNINHKNDTLDEMIIRMRRYAAELFEHTNIRCQLTLHPGTSVVKTGMEQRRDLYLVYKESLNNIYKHAAAQHIEIDLKTSGNKITLVIKDDGKGFDTSQQSHRNGLKNMKTRVEKWNGTISIESEKGIGTAITIEMNLN